MFVTRFAPSPTGYLHRGHAFSALTAAAAARAAGGRMLLRIEDIDAERRRPEFDAAILEDLDWLGIRFDGPVVRQSDRLDAYAGAIESLATRGLVYRCFRTRKEVLAEIARAPHAGEGEPAFQGAPMPPDEEEALLASGAPYAWRLSLEAARAALGKAFGRLTFLEQGRGPGGESGEIAVDASAAGDVILARKGLGAAYHLAVVVDDAWQGITHVTRGEDLHPAAHVQRLLQALLGLPAPVYRHHRLLLRPDGKRFAKRDAAETLRELRTRGVTAAALREELGFE